MLKKKGVEIDQTELLEFINSLNKSPSTENINGDVNKNDSASAEKNSAKSDTTSSIPMNSQNSGEQHTN